MIETKTFEILVAGNQLWGEASFLIASFKIFLS